MLSYKGHNVQHCCLKYMKGGIGTQQRIHLLHCGHSYVVVNMEFFTTFHLSPGTAMPVRCLLIACVKELMNSCLAKSLTILSTYCRLPSQREQHCEPRQRVHNFQHPTQSSHFLTVTISCECCLRMSLDVHYQPQSVAEISHHSVLSGGRIRQCETSRPRRCLTLSNPAP